MFESFNDFTNSSMPLNEGMFSFKTLGDNKAISARSGADIYMFDDKGNMWHEENYEGYGIFGGKDFFELMAEMNGEEGRDIGIDLYYSDNKKVLYPALTRDEDFNWKRHKFTTKIKSDPKQGWFYESVVNEIQHGGSQWKQMDRMVKDSDKEALGKSLGRIFRALLDDYDYDEIWDYTVSIFRAPKYYRMLESFDATSELNEASVTFTADQLNGLHRILVLKMDQNERIAGIYGHTLNTMLSNYIKRAESKPGNKTAVKVSGALANAMNQLLSNNDNQLSSDDVSYVRSKIDKLVTESEVNEARSWGTFGTPEAKKVIKQMDKSWDKFSKTVSKAHADFRAQVKSIINSEDGSKSGIMDSEGGMYITGMVNNFARKEFMMNDLGDISRYGYMQDLYEGNITEEEIIEEAKSIAKIQKEWGNVTSIMKDTVAKYKTAQGQEKEDLLDELKSLTASKKQLEAELDAAVGLKDMDAELAEAMVSAKRGHEYYKLSKDVDVAYIAGLYGMGMEIPGVLIKTKTGHFKGQKDAYILDYYGSCYYVDMDNEVAMSIESIKDQSRDFQKSLKPVDKAPEHSDWKHMVTETVHESIKAEDVKPGAKFKIKGGTIFRIDDVEDHKKQGMIVHSSMADSGKKNAYRDSLDDFVEFLNDEKAKVLENATESRGTIELVSESYNELNERTLTLKRRYTENYPAVTAGKSARIRNKMLEAIADGKITQEEFNAILKEMSNHPGKWSRRNAKYFNVSEDGISLSKFGKRALKQITINEEDMNEARENWVVYTGEVMKKFYSEHTSKKSAEKMVDMAIRVLNQVGMMTKSEWEKEKKAGNVMENTKFVFESFEAFETGTLNEASFVVWYEDKEGKHLLGTFHNKKAADKYKSEEEDEVLNVVGVKAIGTMSKAQWDKKEAPYIKESRLNEGKYDAILDEVADIVKDASNFMNIGIGLKEAGIKYDFSTGMMPMYQLKKHPIAILNKKYVERGDREVGDVAIGVLESVDTEGTELVTEAFKSSKLRNLLTMRGADGKAIKSLARAFYGLTKYKLDELPDAALRDVDPQTAYKSYQKDKEFAVFYIADNEKENPYGDSDWERKIEPGIIGITRGKEFLGATHDTRKMPATLMPAASDNAVGGDKRYSGYGATGIYNVKRAAELADRAIVVWLNNDVFKSTDQVKQRADAKEGAIAFKSDKEFKDANMYRYRQILATKASKLPLDKMVEKAINDLSAQIKDGLAKGEFTRYGDILIGKNKKGNDVRMRDASNHMSNILDAYSKYVSYTQEAQQEKDSGYSSGFYEKEAKSYAKRVADDIKKIKSFDYAW